MQFDGTPEGVETRVRPGERFQGFDGVLQGGIAAGLMDDAMWYAIYHKTQVITMTVELTVRYRAPIPVETDLTVIGRLIEQRRSLYSCEASILDGSGKALATAQGKFMPAPANVVERLQTP